MQELTVAIAQTAPRLGVVSWNLGEIERMAESARGGGARLVVYPELALTGYAVQDAVSTVALGRSDPRLRAIADMSRGLALVVGFVEEGPNGSFYNAAAIVRDGDIVTIHRKRHLPTYALFDEGRFFEPGAEATLFDVDGWRLGVLICEEAWYPATVDELVMAGAEGLVIAAAGPGRGIERGPRWRTQESWLDLVRHYARVYALPVLLANRTGVEEGLFFGGCSALIEPDGTVACQAALFDEALITGRLSRAALRRARMRNPGRPAAPRFDSLLFPPAAVFASAEDGRA